MHMPVRRGMYQFMILHAQQSLDWTMCSHVHDDTQNQINVSIPFPSCGWDLGLRICVTEEVCI